MLADPSFWKLPQPQQMQAIVRVASKRNANFNQLKPADQVSRATALLDHVGRQRNQALQGASGILPAWTAPYAHAAEDYIGAPAAMVAGGALGLAGGAAAGGASPVPGGAEIGAYAGARAGEGVGNALADYLSARVNHFLYGEPYDTGAPGTVPGFQHRGGALEQSAATGAFLGPLTKPIEAAGGFITGRGEAERLARDTAEKAVQDATQAATAAGAAQHAANQQETAALHEKAATNLQRLSNTLAEHSAQLAEAKQQKAQQITKDVMAQRAPAQSASALHRLLGKTPQESEIMAATTDRPTAVARRTQMQDAFFGPIRQSKNELGQRFENLFQGARNIPVPAQPVRAEAAHLSDFLAADQGAVSAPVAKMLKEARQIGLGGAVEEPNLAQTFDPEQIRRMAPDKRAEILQQQAATTQGRLASNSALGQPVRAQQLLELRGIASPLIIKAPTARERMAAYRVVNQIDDVLGESGVPGASKLRKEYGFVSDLFDRNAMAKIGKTIEPSDLGKMMFEEPQRFNDIWRHANPTEKDTIRENFADYALGNGITLKDVGPGKKVNSIVLHQMYGDGPLADVRTWIDWDPKTTKWADYLKADPEAAKVAQASYDDEMQRFHQKLSSQLRTGAYNLAKDLGPLGKQYADKLLFAKNPDEINAIAQEMHRELTPERLAQALQAAQKTPEDAARGSLATLAQATQRTLIDMTGDRVSLATAQEYLHNIADQKALEILQRMPRAMQSRYIQYMGPAYGALVVTDLMRGRLDAFPMIHVAAWGALGMSALSRRALRNPESARVFWSAIKEGQTKHGLQAFGQKMSKLMATEAIRFVSPTIESGTNNDDSASPAGAAQTGGQ